MRVAFGFNVISCFVVSLFALAAPAAAATLQGVELAEEPHYMELALSFDKVPSLKKELKQDPRRWVLTFDGCGSAVSQAQAQALAKLSGRPLSRVTLRPSGGALSVNCVLDAAVEPLIQREAGRCYVRFYAQPSVEHAEELAPGVTYIEKVRSGGGGNLALHLVRLSSGCPITLYSAGADRYDGRTRLRTPSSFARKEGADIVVNGGFFGGKGQHLSTFVEGGIVRATGVYPTRPMLLITDEGEARVGRFGVETLLRFGEQSLTVAGKNYPFESGRTFVYDHTYPLETLPQSAMYYYVIRGGALRFHGADTAGLALGAGELLLANDIMPEANPLRRIAADAAVSLETRITELGAGTQLRARSALGGAPVLIRDGRIELSVQEDRVRDDVAKSVRSRTAIALTHGGELLIAVVGEHEDSDFSGVSLQRLAELLLAEGAREAVNLDGGGSSALVVRGRSVNLLESAQRPVSNVLCIKIGAPQV